MTKQNDKNLGINDTDENIQRQRIDNDCIMLSPCILTDQDSISVKTLINMDEAVSNFKMDKESGPIDLSDFNVS